MATYEPFIWPIPTSKVVKVPKLFRTLLSLIFTAPFPSELGFAPLLDDDDDDDGTARCKMFDKITEEECSVVAINAAKLGEIAFKARDFHEVCYATNSELQHAVPWHTLPSTNSTNSTTKRPSTVNLKVPPRPRPFP